MPVNSFDNYELSWKPDRSRIEPPLYLGLASMLERDIRLIVNRADLPKALQIMRAKFDKADFKTEWKA